ncbi:hypothetical protein AB1N83_012906 [Pleurotus pulmonarius]
MMIHWHLFLPTILEPESVNTACVSARHITTIIADPYSEARAVTTVVRNEGLFSVDFPLNLHFMPEGITALFRFRTLLYSQCTSDLVCLACWLSCSVKLHQCKANGTIRRFAPPAYLGLTAATIDDLNGDISEAFEPHR